MCRPAGSAKDHWCVPCGSCGTAADLLLCPGVLPCCAAGICSLFAKPGVVQNQNAVGVKLLPEPVLHAIEQARLIPETLIDELLQELLVAHSPVLNGIQAGRHRLNAPAVTNQQDAPQVTFTSPSPSGMPQRPRIYSPILLLPHFQQRSDIRRNFEMISRRMRTDRLASFSAYKQSPRHVARAGASQIPRERYTIPEIAIMQIA